MELCVCVCRDRVCTVDYYKSVFMCEFRGRSVCVCVHVRKVGYGLLP